MKIFKLPSFLSKVSPGFTMIELLVVIAVIGVLAVAVLSSINPIEQINKGRDTRTRSDAAQLINAIDRYFAIHESYPWNDDNASASPAFTATIATYNLEFDFVGGSAADWNWADILVTTAEVKSGFTNRVKNDDTIDVYKPAGTNATMYACFIPTSYAFKKEASDNCNNGTTQADFGTGFDPCPNDTVSVPEDDNYICLP